MLAETNPSTAADAKVSTRTLTSMHMVDHLTPTTEYGYDCNYNRQAKKRGRVPLKEKRSRELDLNESSPSSTAGEMTSLDQDQHDMEPSSAHAPDFSSVLLDAARKTSISAAQQQQQEQQQKQQQQQQPQKGSASTPIPLELTPITQDFDPLPLDHRSNSSLQHSELSGGLPRLMGNHRLAASSNGSFHGSFHGSPSAQAFFVTPNPTINFGLSNPEELDRPSPTTALPSECRYRCLEPLLPFIGHSFPVSVACDLFDVFLLDPGASLWRFSSPFILTRVFRRKSLLGPNPRLTSPALLATILWCCAQTADISVLLVPGSRAKLTNALYELATYLISQRDPDRWRRVHGGLQVEYDREPNHVLPDTTSSNEPAGSVDDVLTFILLCIAVSAGDFKADCLKWWSKAKRLAQSLRLDRQDAPGVRTSRTPLSLAEVEAQEEGRRVFWLLYAVDRHLALSYNRALDIPDAICDVYGWYCLYGDIMSYDVGIYS